MSFFTAGGTAIPIASDGVSSYEIEETGTRERMFDASMLECVRARKRVIGLATPLLTRALAETYQAALLASPPITCNGDLFNNVATDCFVRLQGLTPQPTASGAKWRLRFTVYEA